MVKNLLLSAVNRGDLRRLNYSKTVFGRGAPPLTPQRELITLSQTPELMRMGILPPHSPPLSPRDPRAPRSPSELVPPLNAPAHQGVKLTTVISRLNHCVERLLHYHCTLLSFTVVCSVVLNGRSVGVHQKPFIVQLLTP